MKILLATRTYSTISHGPAKFAQFCVRIHKDFPGHEVRVLTEDAGAEQPLLYSIRPNYPKPLEAFNKFFRMRAYHRAARQIHSTYPFDVLIYNDAVQGLVSAWNKGRPYRVVGMLNDSSYLTHLHWPGEAWRKAGIRWIYRQAEAAFVRKADLTLTCSKWLAQKVREEYRPASWVSTLYKTVDVEALSYGPPVPRRVPVRIMFLKSDPHLGGLDVLLEAISLLKDFRFELSIGGFPEEKWRLIHQPRIVSPNCSIRVLGFLPQEKVFSEMRNADIFCVPSRTEGLGVANIEALALGTPVVTSSAGGIPEVMDHGRNGWMARAGDAEDLARCLRECIENPDERLRRSLAGRAYMEKHFDYRQMLAGLLQILEEVCASP